LVVTLDWALDCIVNKLVDTSGGGAAVLGACVSIITSVLRSIANNLLVCVVFALDNVVARNVLADLLAGLLWNVVASLQFLVSTDSKVSITVCVLAVFWGVCILDCP
jgi:hypothetical protein